MDVIYGIVFLGAGFYSLYVLLKDKSILDSLKKLETDRGVSYYAEKAVAILFIIAGIVLIIRYFINDGV